MCERETRGCCGVPVAESAVAPPGSIPNPVVTHGSAGEYCRGDAVGGEAAAGAPQDPHVARFTHHHPARGGAVAARWAHNPKVGGSNPPPATNEQEDQAPEARSSLCLTRFFDYTASSAPRWSPFLVNTPVSLHRS